MIQHLSLTHHAMTLAIKTENLYMKYESTYALDHLDL